MKAGKLWKFICRLHRHPWRELKRRYYSYLSRKLINSKSYEVPAFPAMVTIEMANYCNLNCPLCPTGSHSHVREPGLVDPDFFRSLVDEIAAGGTSVLGLHAFGESLLHPRFHELVKYAVSKDLYVFLDTNLNMIETRHDAEKLITCGINEIRISCDGADQETYEAYRRQGDLAKLKQAVKWMVEIRNEHHRTTPKLVMQALILKQNENKLAAICELSNELGIDEFGFEFIWVDLRKHSAELIRRFLPENPANRWYRENESGEFEIDSVERGYCSHPLLQMLIFQNGDVGFCCLDLTLNMIVGNVREQSVKEIWNGEKMRELRRRMRDDFENMPRCSICPAAYHFTGKNL